MSLGGRSGRLTCASDDGNAVNEKSHIDAYLAMIKTGVLLRDLPNGTGRGF